MIGSAATQAQDDLLKTRRSTFMAKDFKLESGSVMPEVTIA